MSKHSQSRAIILQNAGIIPENRKRAAGHANITERDYAAVPPPPNLMIHPAGDCLIWRWRLNAGGYGVAAFSSQEQLAHRQAFTQSRGHRPNLSVLHLCHRPFCVQPSHLYDGSTQENSQDRVVRTSPSLRLELFDTKSAVVQSVAKYRWPSPPQAAQDPLLAAPAPHDCEFIVPALDSLICPTCGRDNHAGDTEEYFTGAPQPESNDPNVASISSRSRSFRNLAEGIVLKTDLTTDYSIPLNRAERRRRDKLARKSPFRDRPLHLGSTRVKFKPGAVSHFEFDANGIPITGPGVLLLMATPVKPHDDGSNFRSHDASAAPSSANTIPPGSSEYNLRSE